MSYVQIQTHSHYSFLRALPKIPELVQKAKEYEMPALALTDAGNLHGAISFYKECTKHDIKPIIGVHTYVAPGKRTDPHDRDHDLARIILIAQNKEGYENLLAIVTESYLTGFWERPRIDTELLQKYNKGIIAILPTYQSETSNLLTSNNTEGAAAILALYKELFKDRLYLELTRHPEQKERKKLEDAIIKLSEQEDVPLLANQEVYYLHPNDNEAREVLMRIREGRHTTGANLDLSFKSPKEMEKLFKDIPHALENTHKLADSVDLSFDLGNWVFPNIAIESGLPHQEELTRLAYEGIKTRNLEQTDELVERLEYELNIIKTKGYAPYFLVVADLLRFAREHNILSTIRGSVAGSLTTYLLGITTVNPLEYKLPFERFLNPERPSAPDIDMDFADNRRDEVIQYARDTYGEDHVAQIGTFGTMMARAAVRDTARALGHPYMLGDRIAKLIPMGSQGFPMTIDRAMELEPDLKKLYRGDEDVQEIIDLAKKIEGCARQTGVHAAGVVIAPTPLIKWAPIQHDPKGGKLITQYDMHSVEDAGLLKFDFLGIKNLAILADAVARTKEETGDKVDIEHIPLDDPKTFKLLADGHTEGLFQLNGSGMTRFLKELKPTNINDINAMVALYRPGPMESIPQYIERKYNPKRVTYMDDRMRDILDASYGLITYQDDVLLIAIKLAGYSWLEADKLRKAMGKKIPEEMEKQKEKFINGCVSNGMNIGKAEKIWGLIAPFAGYGFNKCITGDTRIYNPETGVYTSVQQLIDTNQEPVVASVTHAQKLVPRKARWIRENGVKQVFKMTLRSGRVLRATSNHPLLTFSGWRELGSLSQGDRIAVPRTLPHTTKQKSTPSHEAAALGYLLAEGNLCHPHGLYFYSKNESEINDFTKAALCFPNTSITLNTSKSAISAYVGKKERKEKNGMYVWADQLGILGKRATEKYIPDTTFTYDQEALACMLGKLWQGDGCVSVTNTQTFYATSSQQLAHDIQHLLLRFGIQSTIHKKSFAYRGTKRPGWTVAVTGLENLVAFESHITPHLLEGKQTHYRLLMAHAKRRSNNRGRGTKDTVPAEVLEHIRTTMNQEQVSAKELAEEAHIHPRLLFHESRKKGYTRDTIHALATALKSETLLSHATSDIFWDEIKSITPDGTEMTYDLSVPDLENFVANDIIVHNSHAASYGRVAYQTAYMKANYPVPYMAALLTADAGETEKISTLIGECERMGISVLPPDINESKTDFTIVENNTKIRFGLISIKNFGAGVAEAIIEERTKNGAFTNIADFLSRVKTHSLNRKGLESLIKSGALDSLASRGSLMKNIEQLVTFHKEASIEGETHDSLFGSLMPTHRLELEEAPDATLDEKLVWEKELLGIYVSGHPLDKYEGKLAKVSKSIQDILKSEHHSPKTVIAGMIEEVKPFLTKKGDKMAFVRIGDRTASIESVIFPKVYVESAPILKPSSCVVIEGQVSGRNGETSIVINKISSL